MISDIGASFSIVGICTAALWLVAWSIADKAWDRGRKAGRGESQLEFCRDLIDDKMTIAGPWICPTCRAFLKRQSRELIATGDGQFRANETRTCQRDRHHPAVMFSQDFELAIVARENRAMVHEDNRWG